MTYYFTATSGRTLAQVLQVDFETEQLVLLDEFGPLPVPFTCLLRFEKGAPLEYE